MTYDQVLKQAITALDDAADEAQAESRDAIARKYRTAAKDLEQLNAQLKSFFTLLGGDDKPGGGG